MRRRSFRISCWSSCSARSATSRLTTIVGVARSHPSYLRGHSASSCAGSRHSGQGAGTAEQRRSRTRFCHVLGRPRDPRRRLQTYRSASSGGRRGVSCSGSRGRVDGGHLPQAADRLVSTRVRRAAAARDVRSAGTASPVPKYISSGVCPRNAECGSTRLCSCT
jgi:hypothetical protein